MLDDDLAGAGTTTVPDTVAALLVDEKSRARHLGMGGGPQQWW